MSPLSDTFAKYFFKHFPQLRGRITPQQQEDVKTFAESITNEQDCQKIWDFLEANPFLLAAFTKQVNFLMKPKRLLEHLMIFFWVFVIVLCLIMTIYFKHQLPVEILDIVSVVLGIFGFCLKDCINATRISEKTLH